MNYKTYKVNCTSIHSFLTSPKDNKPPTDNEIQDFLRFLNKDSIRITPPQIETLRKVIHKRISYDPERLSETAIKELIKTYAFEEYGCSGISYGGNWIPTEKGRLAEPGAVELLSKLDGIPYKKNEKLYKGRWFKGIPDIIVKNEDKSVKKVIEIKIPTSLADYFHVLNGGLDLQHEWQMRGYLDIFKCAAGEVIYCLVNMPEVIYEAEKQRITNVLTNISAPQEEIERQLKQLHANMHYDHIPESQRIIRFPVEHDHNLIKSAHQRVKLARTHLQKMHELFQKPLNLIQTDDTLPENID